VDSRYRDVDDVYKDLIGRMLDIMTDLLGSDLLGSDLLGTALSAHTLFVDE